VVPLGFTELASAHQTLRSWLTGHAYELWWTHGADHARGGFHERLRQDATPTDEPRRGRLHPRQMFAYARAAELGWAGNAARAVEHALDFFLRHYRRSDGLFRTCVAPDGAPRNDTPVLYDQAFALLGFASAYAALRQSRVRALAHELHDTLHAQLAHPAAGFEESVPRVLPLTANSHMHLLEASLAWRELDEDPRWGRLAAHIVELALERFIDPGSGVLHEFFDADWRPMTGAHGRIIEPGHQFEWAGLLIRHTGQHAHSRITQAALRLLEIGESRGVDRNRRVAVDALADESAAAGGQARLWPQTERIKAACIAAELTGHASACRVALEATHTLARYLDTPMPGLWRDRMSESGTFLDEPAPASSLYHLVGAVAELERFVRNDAWHKTNK
jgi:mannose/cellobiose epimerase-like protein (N-acyl-D-glucosamine 2-epimerase family)